jgi:hypothetical protein
VKHLALPSLLLAVAIALTGCGASTDAATSADPATSSAAPSTSTAPKPAPAVQTLIDKCVADCNYLAAASDQDCPEPLSNVSLCVDLLTDLVSKAYDLRAAVEDVPFAARDFGDVLAAADDVEEASTDFSDARCYEMTNGYGTTEGLTCGVQTLTIRLSVSTFGLKVQGMVDDLR